jgi:hypothetical protein
LSLEAVVSATGKVAIMIICIVFRSSGISYRKSGILIICIVFRSYGISSRQAYNEDNL